MDYCLKVQRAGWERYYVPSAVIVHHGGKSAGGEHSKFSSVMMAESGWRFFRTQHGAVQAASFRVCLAAKAAARTCLLGLMSLAPVSEVRRKWIQSALGKWTSVLRWAFGGEEEIANLR
jgi:GT2 family glycosyltransferase